MRKIVIIIIVLIAMKYLVSGSSAENPGDKYLSLQIRDKMIDKTTMRNALSVFRRFQLIEILDRDLANEESRILIYDSILMAVQIDDIKKAYEKVEIYRKGRQTDEEADENEAD